VDLLRGGEGADVVADFLDELLAQRVVALLAGVQGDVGVDRAALDVVRVEIGRASCRERV